jgi:DNA-binding transcriptional MerR regulator
MNASSTPLWTIEELTAQAALALSVDYAGQCNGRVRDVPDLRTARYYTTLGLLDRPAAMRGRTGLYGRRHLLQLVAIKRLQAQGASLAELQQRLVGLTDSELARIARLPPEPVAPPPPSARSQSFWKQPPAPVAPPRDAAPSDGPMQGVQLGAAVTLLLQPARPLETDDLEAIRAAAAPLLKVLEKRRLTTEPPTPGAPGS